ncbi:DegV family protein [Caproicibacter sp.]|uniref:DegV family protein n=1 Tax=Caproicibacter sp. TaxID=2814884 RepID=UPI0039891F74
MSNTICQIVDSSGNLPRSLLEQQNISEVPFYFKFNNPDYYRENIDYNITEFYKHMEEYPHQVPKTSCPNIYDWLTVFEQQYAKGAKQYIVTTISSKLSASFQTAISAKKLFEEENSDIQIEVIDSNICACGQASLEIGIAKMIESGKSFEDIIETANKMVSNTTTLFVVNSLKYMKSGGRIGGATAFLGKLINVKPICEFVDGVVHPVKAVRGRKNSLKTMIDIAVSRISDLSKMIVIIQNAEYQEDANYIINYLRETSNFSGQIYKSDLGITVGAHSGPGAIGIGFVENPLM